MMVSWFIAAMGLAVAAGYVLRWGQELLREFRRDLREDREREPGHIGVLDADADVARIKEAFGQDAGSSIEGEVVATPVVTATPPRGPDDTQILHPVLVRESGYQARHRAGARRLVHFPDGTQEQPLVPLGQSGFSVSSRAPRSAGATAARRRMVVDAEMVT